MTVNDICEKAKAIVGRKTIYVRKCPGLKLAQTVKLKYTSLDPFNAKRTATIFAADESTEGYDEITFINSVLGKKYSNAGEIMNDCVSVSKDFSTLVPGNIVFGKDSVGIYVGDEKVITCDTRGVVKTNLTGWVSHGTINGLTVIVKPIIEEVKKDDGIREMDGDSERTEENKEDVKETPDRTESRMDVRNDRIRRRH